MEIINQTKKTARLSGFFVFNPRMYKIGLMKKFGVIGYPIAHSKSPQLHEAGFIEMEIDATFEKIEVHPDDLSDWLTNEFPNYAGIAVTIPHKETIMKLVDKIAPAAEKIGAINTLYWENEIIVGTNTDCLGALKALQTECPELTDKKVLILGAGGASRAVIFALKSANSKIFCWNRTQEKAEKLAEEFDIETVENIKAVHSDNFDVIINTTSVGLKKWESPVPADFFSANNVVFDIVYDPLETKFLADAEAAGAVTITGDKMLVYQALEQFKIWNDIELEPEVMENAFFE